MESFLTRKDFKTMIPVPVKSEQHKYTIGGVPVSFPCKPYPTQIQMMSKIIQALNKRENALLESPTGSGKSLALLCSSLAWQKCMKCECSCHRSGITVQPGSSSGNTATTNTDLPANVVKMEAIDSTVQGVKTEPLQQQSVKLEEAVDHVENKLVVSDAVKQESSLSLGEECKSATDQQIHSKRKRRGLGKPIVYEDPIDDESASTVASTHPKQLVELKEASDTASHAEASLELKVDTAQLSSHLPQECSSSNSTSSCSLCHCGAPGRQHSVIYFCTRTHKQITQIVHELRKTVYHDVRMSILSSRNQSCIHDKVSKSKKKNDECQKLIQYTDGASCKFYFKVQQKLGTQAKLREYGYNTAWDIEDLVNLGKTVKACPYYGARALKDEAEIIFCPYNYLIDPRIRSQMLINIADQVVIFDEAHNMEDSARDAASSSVTCPQLEEVLYEMGELLAFCGEREDLRQFRDSLRTVKAVLQQLVSWMLDQVVELPQSRYEEGCKIWSGEDFLPILKEVGISAGSYQEIMIHFRAIGEGASIGDGDDKDKGPTLCSSSMHLLETLFLTISYLFTANMKFTADYRVALKKIAVFLPPNTGRGAWKRRQSRITEKVWVAELNFWCLNPAVAFSQLQCARSVVLTSGTLSPMKSFASELGMAFPIQLEASHVIPLSQTWVSTIPCGPNGRAINASYQYAETYEFQDELGQVLLKVCETVPNGVLCFLASYKLLEKLTSRWQDTGLWSQLMKKKHVVSEPRAGEKEDFEAVMASFYEHVSGGQNENFEGDEQQNGALFFAVCRGKVSEGLDFADSNARAVITVGIPFPNIKDKQVALKREYNNELCHSKGLLSGSEWYEIQAYRALNQALGRCIRHKRDWGALILVDERYKKGFKYTKGLSKWVRQRVTLRPEFNDAMKSLSLFTQSMQESVSQAEVPVSNTTVSNPPFLPSSVINIPMSGNLFSSSLLHPNPSFSPAVVSSPASASSPTSSDTMSSLPIPCSDTSSRPTSSENTSNEPLLNLGICHNPNMQFSTKLSLGSGHPDSGKFIPSSSAESTSPVLFESHESVGTPCSVTYSHNSLVSSVQICSVSSSSFSTIAPPSTTGSCSVTVAAAPSACVHASSHGLASAQRGLPIVSSIVCATGNSGGTINQNTADTRHSAEDDDDDITPPLSPNSRPCVPVISAALPCSSLTPIASRLRRNVRIGRKRTPLSVTVANVDEDDDDSDFKTTITSSAKRKRKRKNRKNLSALPLKFEKMSTADSERNNLLCTCGKILADTPDALSWVSLSRLVGVETSGSDMTQVLQNSWLCSYLRGHLMLEPSEISFVSIDNIPPTCTPRKGSGWGNNAVWDEALKWCFQLLDCSCGKMAGIKIFHSTDRPDLKNTVQLLVPHQSQKMNKTE